MEPVSTTALGIDVSKKSLDLALLLPDGRLHTKSVRNDPSGLEALTRWLDRLGVKALHACLEATGGLEEAAALHIQGLGHRVSVVNPRRIKAYAEAQLQRNKTDRADAALIARFCQREQPAPWQPPSAEQRTLRDLTRGLEALKAQRKQLRSRHDDNDSPPVRQALKAVLSTLDEQIQVLEGQIETHVAAHPKSKQQADLLCSIPGIGPQTASVILAELGPVERFGNARQAAAYAGLTPRNYRSGQRVWRRTRLSKVGNARLRRALYFPAMSALRYNVVVREFGERLRAAGLEGKAVVGAAMRKLLHICFGVLKSGRAFDPSLHLCS